MFLLGNLGQQLDIHDTQDSLKRISEHLREANRFDRDVSKSIEGLIRENAELKLYLAAVLRIMVAKGVVSQTELKSIVEMIDQIDGQADGLLKGKLPPPG